MPFFTPASNSFCARAKRDHNAAQSTNGLLFSQKKEVATLDAAH